MLVDVTFKKPDPFMAIILGAVSSGKFLQDPSDDLIIPNRIGQGMYLATHWQIDDLGVPLKHRYAKQCGVCDTPEQAVEKLGLRDSPEKVFVSFVRIRRDEQPAQYGWRWHKWGPYIGDQKPTCEYIAGEPEIEEVYTFHVYEPALE